MRRISLIGAVLGLAAVAGGGARADLIVSLEAPGVQSTSVSGVTETFDEFSPGRYSSLASTLGTYTASTPGGIDIAAADQYGGSNGTNYVAIGAESGGLSMTLNLTTPQAYFGFDWQAGDNNNVLQFYSGTTLLGTFHTSDLVSFINQQADRSAYYGNPDVPNNGQDSSEPFAYVNIYTTSPGETFDSIVFSNNLSSGFESDNHSVAATAPTSDTGTVVENVVPEPSSLALGLVGSLACLASARLRRRKAAAI